MKSKSLLAIILVYLLSVVALAALMVESDDDGKLTKKKLGNIFRSLWDRLFRRSIFAIEDTRPGGNDATHPPKINQSADEDSSADATCSDGSAAAASDNNDDDELVAQLLHWLVANGAYVNPKIVVRHLIPTDPTSMRGIFATDAIAIGETVYGIPWKLVLRPRNSDDELPTDEDCGTFEAVANSMRNGGKTPYGKYLLNQPKDYTAAFWSQASIGYMLLLLQLKISPRPIIYMLFTIHIPPSLPPHSSSRIGWQGFA